MIKDSGDRTEFETGAKRDMHAGKGRMDLLPWYGIMEVSKHCEEGALKYGEHNVDKGIPLHSLLDSASRHLAKYMVGMDDEDHLRAACWNLLWALNQRETHPELDDRFAVKVGEVKKKNYQVLCPNCEATIIKENGQICDGVGFRKDVSGEKLELKCCFCNHSVLVPMKDILDDRFSVKQEKTQKKRPWISVECTNCNKRHPVAPEGWLYDMDEVPASSRILKCPFCNGHWVHKYIGDLDGYADPDEKLVAVKCGGCNAHFGIPASNWNSMKECTIHNGEVLACCPRCGKDTFISEVKPDE